jgi:hypothetical protein
MAMEDAQVLAESLTAESHLDAALTTFVTRRRPPVDWVRKQSRGIGHMLSMPAAERNAAPAAWPQGLPRPLSAADRGALANSHGWPAKPAETTAIQRVPLTPERASGPNLQQHVKDQDSVRWPLLASADLTNSSSQDASCFTG